MKIVTFYSYKGGTGRSVSLANVARVLSARLGQRVGVVDLDIEAAALHEIFGAVVAQQNLLTLLLPKFRNVSNLEQHVLEMTQGDAGGGRLFLLPTITDAKVVDEVRWDSGVDTFLENELFPAFGRVYQLDYLLLDARSGLSTFATFALRVADLVVLVARADRQNRLGIRKMVEVCRSVVKPFVVLLSGCPAPERHRKEVETFETAIGVKADFVTPYLEDLYFEEFLVADRAPDSGLGRRYQEIAERVHARTGQL